MTATIAPALAPEDLTRLSSVTALISANDTGSVLATALPSLDAAERAALARHTRFTHAAVLVFPSTFDRLREELAGHGIETAPMIPSVVVRNRLSSRYGVPADELAVGILHAAVPDRAGDPCEVEIFAMATPPELAHIAADERRNGRENHFALVVPSADPIVLSGLRAAVAAQMRPDGGGYNGHEDNTVLYFRDADHRLPAFRRLELVCAGQFPRLLADHQRESAAGTGLLRLMTGAWATQAIAAAAELRLPDHLVTISDVPGLAAATGADPDSLGRLLRYLTSLGLVRETEAGYRLTDQGSLLRSDVDGSLRPLALMYGGPFYQSFAALTDAVRTGEESYAKVFGAHHFAHMATDPGLAELFHQSMAASNAAFADLVRVVDLSGAHTVVDIAGGSGELLSRVLAANPAAHGVLLERPHALAAAEATLAPVAERCTLVPGDFTEAVPETGDVYLLSRVLHDWDDAQCRAILATIEAAMPGHAELLVIERLLPADTGSDSLAVAWDVHMLCNVGGRERAESHYRALLSDAGFELTSAIALPLDTWVLRARKRLRATRDE
ncbi:methyltransferase [Amycolatopsis sp. NBC_00345]|uniref:methyltransferase n=1 Tax=Amycolatopsis sp. NBC_00345 TaxID=2975955 RepID=UPI002E252B0B